MRLISERLGHTSERITSDTYVHTDRAHLELVAAAMSEALWPEGDGASDTGS
jgi:integrase